MRQNLQRCLMMFMCLLSLTSVGAHEVTEADEAELKAAFIYNFTLFTHWPRQQQKMRMCLLGDISYASKLSAYNGRNVNGAILQIEKVESATEALSCQLLIVDIKDQVQINNIKEELQVSPVLIVADAKKFATDSVHILLIRNNNRLTFDVNQTAAKASGISFSFKLLQLAHKVY